MSLEKSEQKLFEEISALIDQTKRNVSKSIDMATVGLFWHIGKMTNAHILKNKRADYGKQIVVSLARQLEEKYGRTFNEKNFRRMLQFSEQFDDVQIVVLLKRQFSWTHMLALLPLKNMDAQFYYADRVTQTGANVKSLREMIKRKEFERIDIANSRLPDEEIMPFNTFKDPYLLDMFGLSDKFLEKDLESAILNDLENFILEFGKDFTFVKRQKRMILDGKDFYLDLLFYNRELRRLVAVELKIGEFLPQHKGQMELYLKWLDRYERKEGEKSPIGLILCTQIYREQIELLEMHKDGIMVAEYLTSLPPKVEFEKKIRLLVEEAKERVERRMLLENNGNMKRLTDGKSDDSE
jgi:predicted nuclease of restriction endonuclease-like (RecB) superfamily